MYMATRDPSTQGILSCSHVPELSRSQEKVDTKMFLCAQFAAGLGLQSVEIITVDSDVAILFLYFSISSWRLQYLLTNGIWSKGRTF